MTITLIASRHTLDDQIRDAINDWIRTGDVLMPDGSLDGEAFAAQINVGVCDPETFPCVLSGFLGDLEWDAVRCRLERQFQNGWYWVTYSVVRTA